MNKATLQLFINISILSSIRASVDITNGKLAKDGQFPYHIFLIAGRHSCNAVLLTETYALTAAHCVTEADSTNPLTPDDVLALMGSAFLFENIVERELSSIIIHENFQRHPFAVNDIAIIEFNEPVEFTKFLMPAVLPDKDFVFDEQIIAISGFGRTGSSLETSHLLYTNEVVYNFKLCQEQYANDIAEPFRVTNDMFCAVGIEPGAGACMGDSGGPAVLNGTSILVGILFWGYSPDNMCTHELPDVFDRITNYVDWIHDKIPDGLNATY